MNTTLTHKEYFALCASYDTLTEAGKVEAGAEITRFVLEWADELDRLDAERAYREQEKALSRRHGW